MPVYFVYTPRWAYRLRRIAQAIVSWTYRFDTYAPAETTTGVKTIMPKKP